MIGNSPKSDINPALAAGLNAVFIPHDFTWVLEHEVVASAPPGRTLLELARFAICSSTSDAAGASDGTDAILNVGSHVTAGPSGSPCGGGEIGRRTSLRC